MCGKQRKYRCTLCAALFDLKVSLTAHLVVDHMHWFRFKCSFCTEIYLPTEDAITRHFASTHDGMPSQATYFCNEKKVNRLDGLLESALLNAHLAFDNDDEFQNTEQSSCAGGTADDSVTEAVEKSSIETSRRALKRSATHDVVQRDNLKPTADRNHDRDQNCEQQPKTINKADRKRQFLTMNSVKTYESASEKQLATSQFTLKKHSRENNQYSREHTITESRTTTKSFMKVEQVNKKTEVFNQITATPLSSKEMVLGNQWFSRDTYDVTQAATPAQRSQGLATDDHTQSDQNTEEMTHDLTEQVTTPQQRSLQLSIQDPRGGTPRSTHIKEITIQSACGGIMNSSVDDSITSDSPNHTATQDVKRTGKVEHSFTCPWTECDKRYRRSYHLKRHLFEHTRERKPVVCDWEQCQRRFVENSELRRHAITHTGERPFKCDSCHKCFSHKHWLLQHAPKCSKLVKFTV